MLGRKALDGALKRVSLTSASGIWWRTVGHHLLLGPPPGASPGTPPQPLWPEGSSRFGARFTPKGGAPAIYLASEPTIALLEVNAVYLLPKGPAMAIPAAPQTVFQVDARVSKVLDLTDATTLKTLKTSVQELTGDWRYAMSSGTLPPTHVLGDAVHRAGRISAIRTYSAKSVGQGTVLVVFPDRLSHGSSVELIDPTGMLHQRFP
jgi:RES domain-containing protein